MYKIQQVKKIIEIVILLSKRDVYDAGVYKERHQRAGCTIL
jgi:hypothetical protein